MAVMLSRLGQLSRCRRKEEQQVTGGVSEVVVRLAPSAWQEMWRRSNGKWAGGGMT